MAIETLKLSHLIASVLDGNDPVAPADIKCKLLAQAIIAIAQKLDADTADTGGDSDFEATINALTL